MLRRRKKISTATIKVEDADDPIIEVLWRRLLQGLGVARRKRCMLVSQPSWSMNYSCQSICTGSCLYILHHPVSKGSMSNHKDWVVISSDAFRCVLSFCANIAVSAPNFSFSTSPPQCRLPCPLKRSPPCFFVSFKDHDNLKIAPTLSLPLSWPQHVPQLSFI